MAGATSFILCGVSSDSLHCKATSSATIVPRAASNCCRIHLTSCECWKPSSVSSRKASMPAKLAELPDDLMSGSSWASTSRSPSRTATASAPPLPLRRLRPSADEAIFRCSCSA